jgi:hypothetical protein
MTVTQDMDGVREAAVELMVESLKQEDVDRVVENLILHDAEPETLAKAVPRRSLSAAYYEWATYLMWIRGMRDSGVEMEILADEAEGLRAIEAARQEFERDYPGCPQCGTRQYSRFAMSCRKSACGAKFEKGR